MIKKLFMIHEKEGHDPHDPLKDNAASVEAPSLGRLYAQQKSQQVLPVDTQSSRQTTAQPDKRNPSSSLLSPNTGEIAAVLSDISKQENAHGANQDAPPLSSAPLDPIRELKTPNGPVNPAQNPIKNNGVKAHQSPPERGNIQPIFPLNGKPQGPVRSPSRHEQRKVQGRKTKKTSPSLLQQKRDVAPPSPDERGRRLPSWQNDNLAISQRPPLLRQEDETLKRKKIGIYFGKKPLWTLLVMFAAIGLFVHPGRFDPFYGFQMALDWAFSVGLLMLLTALFFRYFKTKAASDRDIDDHIIADLTELEKRAVELMKIESRQLLIDPVTLSSFPDLEKLGPSFRHSRYGKDHILRYTPHALTLFAFTPTSVVTYEGAVDITTGNKLYEDVKECLYQDIITIEHTHNFILPSSGPFTWLRHFLPPWKGPFTEWINGVFSGQYFAMLKTPKSREAFGFSLTNGQKVKVILRDGRMAGEREYEEIPNMVDHALLQYIREFILLKKAPGKQTLSPPPTRQS